MISARTIQEQPFDQYVSGTCDWNFYAGNVEARDWNYGILDESRMCSKLDESVCPQIREDVNVTWDTQIGAPNVICRYKLSEFQTLEDIDVYVQKWGEDNNYNHEIMPHFCAQPVTTCPENNQSSRFTSCSRIVSNGIDGDACREWISQNPELSDEIITKYCDANNTEDCSCISEKTQDVCARNLCTNPSYLTTSTIQERIRACRQVDEEDINDNVVSQNTSSSIYIVLSILLVLIVLGVILWLTFFWRHTSTSSDRLSTKQS